MSGSKKIPKYTKKSHYEHIVDLPDTYIGGIQLIEEELYIIEEHDEVDKIIKKNINYVPGLERIYEEILLNAFDQTVRVGQEVTILKVDIDRETGEISVYNNGRGIPVKQHEEYKVWIPAMIFSELLTSSNYNEKKKIVGGKNGYGAKLTNIFSKRFEIDTIDSDEGKKFVMVCENNMKDKGKPKITKNSKASYVKISFIPDYAKFGIEKLSDDMFALMKKRVYDISACSNKNVKVYFNGKMIKQKTFEQYVNLYIGTKTEKPRIYEACGKRWEVVATTTEGDTFESVSFVNGICTKSGTHVTYIESQITKKLASIIKKNAKKKNGITIKNAFIKNKLFLFIKCFIEDPGFNSQSKQELTTKKSNFGSTCKISDKFVKDLNKKTGIEKEVLSFAEYKDSRSLKKTDGKKTARLTGIPKLEDANWAGTKNSAQCKLLVTEGDSAKTFAISGLSIVGRDKYGVFPLKGKLLNVRQASKAQMFKNDEITNLKKILGLKQDYKYTDLKDMRYGGIVILTDQDVDGSHIKGLLMNWIHLFWPELIELGFLISMATPIVKCFKKKDTKIFYTETEYEQWKHDNNNGKGWKIKYYKGLGTSSAKEAKEYFKEFEDNLIHYTDNEETTNMVNLAFSKEKANDRKTWLKQYNREEIIEQSQKKVPISDFVNKELIHFSNADNLRSIPNVMDGLKPSQRKVLYAALKKNLKNEAKVAQFAGYVGEVSAYHHGDASLHGTIIGMAQNYVSSNNINLLAPNGQFGTRYQNGKDHASARYIFTNLSPISFELFNSDDMPILNYLDDDGFLIEPEFYVPVIPMILVNGCEGIGTGFSTEVQPHNVKDIITALKAKIKGKTPKKLHPWYRGYTGTITELVNEPKYKGKYLVSGSYNIHDEKKCIVEVTEIPVGVSTEKYKEDLEKLILDKSKDIKPHVRAKQCITHYDNYSTESRVRFLVYFDKKKFSKYSDDPKKMIDILKLEKTISTNNMHLYNTNGVITKYKNANDILDAYFDYRLEFYDTRKANMMKNLSQSWRILDNKCRFIRKVITNKIKVFRQKIAFVREQLEEQGFEKFDLNKSGKESYDYLTSLAVSNFTEEKIIELKELRDSKKSELDELEETSIQDLWYEDLDFVTELNVQYNKTLEKERSEESSKISKSKKKKGRGKR